MADELKLKVNGREYPVPENFTLGELADMERITGQGYDLAQGGVLGTLALAFVAIKRVDDRITIDDIRGLTPDEFEMSGGDALPPPLRAQKGSARSSRATSKPGSDE